MRALGLDLGEVRIGVAVSDAAGTVATPVEVLARSGDRWGDHQAIAALIREWEAEVLVVGLPYSLDGSIGPAARRVLAEIDEMGATIRIPITTYDERLTTVSAERALSEQDLDARKRRNLVDMVAASVLLQGWLDARSEDKYP